jgi:hypothetical protein
VIFVSFLVIYVLEFCAYLQLQAVLQENEGIFDHALVTIQKPFYSMNCPEILRDENPIVNDMMVLPSPFFMISARPKDHVDPALATWQSHFNVTLISTSVFSETFRNTRCRTASWKSRLFAVYEHVFAELLSEYPDQSHFCILEDDVHLRDERRFRQDLQWALVHKVDYYSFFPTALDYNTCIYDHGTVAQLISRDLMRQVVDVDTDSFCRLPIDMFIARRGPWYVTTMPLTEHIGTRLHLASNESAP